MSEFRVNSITNQDGSAGPQVCGVSTFSGKSGVQIPSGPTEFRRQDGGGRGRGSRRNNKNTAGRGGNKKKKGTTSSGAPSNKDKVDKPKVNDINDDSIEAKVKKMSDQVSCYSFWMDGDFSCNGSSLCNHVH